MNKFNYKNLTPFKWFVLENFPFIEADFDALTEWQLFCKLGKEINKIINSENNLGTQMENVTNAFINLQNYVNNYFDNLDLQDEVNKKLNEMTEDGTLEEIISKFIKPYIRKFKPELHYSVNWAGLSNGVPYTAPDTSRETTLNLMKINGMDGFILPIQTYYNNETGHFSILNNLEKDLEYSIKSSNNGVPLHALKIHHSNYGKNEIINDTAVFVNDMKSIIDTLYTTFENLNVPYLTIMNELTSLFIDSEYSTLIITLMTYTQSKGYKTGITSAGASYFNRIPDNVLNSSDLLMVNQYVRIGSKRENTTYQDSINAWSEDPYNSWLDFYQGKYRDKKFIISETGCMNYWDALQAPSSWIFEGEEAKNDEAQLTYYEGMFNQCKYVNEVWLWFPMPNTSIFNKYLKGENLND